ncbi:unnamed protein product [Oikopleura dioica]|uniref:Uncharacterized protein n=1 Tax=Oikopleura dioica TaxID=34765 RepID=E4WXS7_OIKDI|nr:unnamed protein product [Oikopleura dioica]CBY39324.1 unnamed protein product [Oikopleura dioica]
MSEGEHTSSDLEEWMNQLDLEDIEDMIGVFTDRNRNNIDVRYWKIDYESKDNSICSYKSESHSEEEVKCLLRQIQLNPAVNRFNIKMEAFSAIITGAGDYEIDIRTNYPVLPTVWSFEMQRPDKRPFTFTATCTIYQKNHEKFEESPVLTSIPMYDRNGIVQTASYSSWGGGAVGRWDVELHF